jgi:Tfp pilus assembly protein PilF
MNASNNLIRFALLVALLVITAACSRNRAPVNSSSVVTPSNTPPVRPRLRGNDATMMAVGFLEERVKSDPDYIVALNKLAAYYIQLHRETEDVSYLEVTGTPAQIARAQ